MNNYYKNRDVLLERCNNYYRNNENRINKTLCTCGFYISNICLKQHKLSKRCKEFSRFYLKD
jgi:hypothetical protein